MRQLVWPAFLLYLRDAARVDGLVNLLLGD